MKRFVLRAAFLAACVMMLAGGAWAQEALRIYIQRDALTRQEQRQLTALLNAEFPQAAFALVEEEEGTLRDLVMRDQAPNLAICSPQEARVWAKEGLTLPLQKHIDDQERLAQEILNVCVYEEKLFMAPLCAQHRQMAVNVRMLEKRAMGYMLDEIAHPVWYPTEFQQMLEEFALVDAPALDIWPMRAQDCAALEALIQAIYGGRLMDGDACGADGKAIAAGVRWLRDLTEGEIIARAHTREAAIDRFLAQETAIFLDWTKRLEEEYAQQIKEAGVALEVRPYPSSSGLPVRSYELVGVSALDCGNLHQNALAVQAAAFLHASAKAEAILGERGVFDDGSIWLWDLSSHERGATLRSLLCGAVNAVLEEGEEIERALRFVQAGMETAD